MLHCNQSQYDLVICILKLKLIVVDSKYVQEFILVLIAM